MTPAEMNTHMMALIERMLFEGQLQHPEFRGPKEVNGQIGWRHWREYIPFARKLQKRVEHTNALRVTVEAQARTRNITRLHKKGWFWQNGAPEGKEWILPPHSPTTVERALMSEAIKAMRRRANGQSTPRQRRSEPLPTHWLAEEQEREDIERYGEKLLDEPFCPDWASPPGHTIVRLLELRAMSSDEFARGMGFLIEDVPFFLNGQIELTAEMATKLEQMFESSASFWVSREAHYREALARGCTDLGRTDPAEFP